MMLLFVLLACKKHVVEEIDYSLVICDRRGGETIETQPVMLEEEAAQCLVVPSVNIAWLIKNDEISGNITIEMEDWMRTLYSFDNEDVTLEIALLESKEEQAWSTGCEWYTQLACPINACGFYPIYFQGEGDVHWSVIHT